MYFSAPFRGPNEMFARGLLKLPHFTTQKALKLERRQ